MDDSGSNLMNGVSMTVVTSSWIVVWMTVVTSSAIKV